jgi:hypothetical protein
MVSDLIGAAPTINLGSIGTVNFDPETAKGVNSWGVRVLGNKLHQFGHEPTVTYELSDDDINALCLSIQNDLLVKLKDDTVEKSPEVKKVVDEGTATAALGVLGGIKPQATSSSVAGQPVSQTGPLFIPVRFGVTNMASQLGQNKCKRPSDSQYFHWQEKLGGTNHRRIVILVIVQQRVYNQMSISHLVNLVVQYFCTLFSCLIKAHLSVSLKPYAVKVYLKKLLEAQAI